MAGVAGLKAWRDNVDDPDWKAMFDRQLQEAEKALAEYDAKHSATPRLPGISPLLPDQHRWVTDQLESMLKAMEKIVAYGVWSSPDMQKGARWAIHRFRSDMEAWV